MASKMNSAPQPLPAAGPGKHTGTWYETISDFAPTYPAFVGKGSFDIIVIGGGLAGITASLELAKRGKSVGLFEAGRLGCGASGRNGGFVSAGFAESPERIEKRVGTNNTRALMALSREGVDYIRAAINTHNMSGVDPVPGWLNVQRFDDGPALQRRAARATADFGRPLEYMDTEKVRALLKSERYFQGIYDANAFHINPLQYTRKLAEAAVKEGVFIFENSGVAAIEEGKPGFTVSLPGGMMQCGQIVVTGSAYLKDVFPEIRRAILPVATHVVVTLPFDHSPSHGINFAGAVSDTRRAGNYYRLLPDQGAGVRLLWGGRITTGLHPPRNLAADMALEIAGIFPQLGRLEIDHVWSGLMGYSRHKMPIIGEVKPGIWACTAFGGHGLNTTAMGGLIVARAICEQDDRIALFRPFGAAWGGGVFSRMITQGTYWAMQARDRLEERRVWGE